MLMTSPRSDVAISPHPHGGDVYLERMSEFPAAPLSYGVELTADGRFVVPPEAAVGCFYKA